LKLLDINVVADAIAAAQIAGTFTWHSDVPSETRRFSGLIIDGRPVTVQSVTDDQFVIVS